MPVIPEGLPAFTIRPPLTTGDKGEPTKSIQRDTARILALIEDERHLTAQALYHSVRDRFHTWQRETKQQEADAAAAAATASYFPAANNNNNNHPKNNSGMVAMNKFALLPMAANKARRKDFEEAAQKAAQEAARLQKKRQEYEQVQVWLEQHRDKLEVLENRCRLFRKAQKNLKEEDEWTLASHLFGIETYYRREPDGTLSLKLQGEMKDIPLFEQVCVLKEVDLHHTWAPFCSSSMTIADLDKLDSVGWFMVGLSNFGLARDGCFRAIGCDNIHEDGSILLVGQGIRDVPQGAPQPLDTYLCNDPILDKLNVPPVPSRRGAARMTIHTFDAIIHVTSPTSAVTKIVANVNPNISFLPQSLLEFIMKHLAGVLLAKLQSAARKVVKNPLHNEHAKKMRAEKAFYQDWLMAKFQFICDLNGWEMPPVNALQWSDEDTRNESHRLVEQKQTRRANTFSGTTGSPSPMDAGVAAGGDDSDGDHLHLDDGISELTSRSGPSNRTWSNGAVRGFWYTRDLLQRTKRKQDDDDLRKVPVMAPQRSIPPNERTPSQVERLGQLPEAQARRLEGDGEGIARAGGPVSDMATVTSQRSFALEASNKSFSETITDRLHSHSRLLRFGVMALALALFLGLLHPELLEICVVPDSLPLWMAWHCTDQAVVWSTRILHGLGLLIYMLLCCVLHFLICDIALVYSYAGLSLGRKAGRDLKKFYSDRVRTVLAFMSFGIYALSVIKALSRVALVMFVSGLLVVSQKWKEWFDALAIHLSAEGTNMTETLNVTMEDRAENVSHSAAQAAQSIRDMMESGATYVHRYVLSLCRLDVEEALNTWQSDAFDTCRVFYLYTAFPLLVFLILFHYTVRQSTTTTATRTLTAGSGTAATETTAATPEPVAVSTSDDDDDDDNNHNNKNKNNHHPDSRVMMYQRSDISALSDSSGQDQDQASSQRRRFIIPGLTKSPFSGSGGSGSSGSPGRRRRQRRGLGGLFTRRRLKSDLEVVHEHGLLLSDAVATTPAEHCLSAANGPICRHEVPSKNPTHNDTKDSNGLWIDHPMPTKEER